MWMSIMIFASVNYGILASSYGISRDERSQAFISISFRKGGHVHTNMNKTIRLINYIIMYSSYCSCGH